MSRLSLLVLLPALLAGVAYAKGKSTEVNVPAMGWYTEPGSKKVPAWRGSCYVPPDFSTLPDIQRREAHQATLEAMKSQWLGQKDDIVKFDPEAVDNAEMALFGRPDQTENVSKQNLEFCKAVMSNGADTAAWSAWLAKVPAQLREGQCVKPLDYSFVQYIRLDGVWQDPVSMCAGDRIDIKVTVTDRYRLSKGGKWITADGDRDDPTAGSKLPCNFEGCFRGEVIGRFVTLDGTETVFPIGSEKAFRAPQHGTFSFMINDDSAEDNDWHSSGAVIDHAALTVSPSK
jgi:hypothetical protein